MTDMKKAAAATILAATLSGGALAVDKPIQAADPKAKTLECATQAIGAVDIPGSTLYVGGDNNTLAVDRTRTETYGAPGAPNQESISATIEINGNDVEITTYHGGTLGPRQDAVKTTIDLVIDGTSVAKREAGAMSFDGSSSTASLQGQWAIAAAQAIEHTYTSCMGLGNPTAPESAARYVGTAPDFLRQ